MRRHPSCDHSSNYAPLIRFCRTLICISTGTHHIASMVFSLRTPDTQANTALERKEPCLGRGFEPPLEGQAFGATPKVPAFRGHITGRGCVEGSGPLRVKLCLKPVAGLWKRWSYNSSRGSGAGPQVLDGESLSDDWATLCLVCPMFCSGHAPGFQLYRATEFDF